MSELGLEAIAVLFLLLPGLLAARVVQSLCVRNKQTELDKIVEALIYTFLVYVIFLQFSKSLPIKIEPAKQNESSLAVNPTASSDQVTVPHEKDLGYTISWNRTALLQLSAIAVGLALLIAFTINSDWLLTFLRAIGVTQQTSRTSVWNDVLYTLPSDAYVSVELEDGRLVLGYLRHYSARAEESSLFLAEASWYSADSPDPIHIDGPGILLTKASGIKTLMFLHGEKHKIASTPTHATHTAKP